MEFPAAGGCYIREPDGSLIQESCTLPAGAAPPEAPEAPEAEHPTTQPED